MQSSDWTWIDNDVALCDPIQASDRLVARLFDRPTDWTVSEARENAETSQVLDLVLHSDSQISRKNHWDSLARVSTNEIEWHRAWAFRVTCFVSWFLSFPFSWPWKISRPAMKVQFYSTSPSSVCLQRIQFHYTQDISSDGLRAQHFSSLPSINLDVLQVGQQLNK